jgi:hypothetical protein
MLRTLHIAIQVTATVAGLMSLSVFSQSPAGTPVTIKNDAKRAGPAFHGSFATTDEPSFKQKRSNKLS